MGRCRIASSDVVRLPLSGGDFLTVRKELNAGEGSDIEAIPPHMRTFPLLIAYLVDWSFMGLDDHPLPYNVMQSVEERTATLRNLDTATMDEIVIALSAHIKANRRAVEEKKTIPEPVSA